MQYSEIVHCCATYPEQTDEHIIKCISYCECTHPSVKYGVLLMKISLKIMLQFIFEIILAIKKKEYTIIVLKNSVCIIFRVLLWTEERA